MLGEDRSFYLLLVVLLDDPNTVLYSRNMHVSNVDGDLGAFWLWAVCVFCYFVFFLDKKGIKVLSSAPFILFFETFLDDWFDFALEDVAADNAVVGMVSLTIGW